MFEPCWNLKICDSQKTEKWRSHHLEWSHAIVNCTSASRNAFNVWNCWSHGLWLGLAAVSDGRCNRLGRPKGVSSNCRGSSKHLARTRYLWNPIKRHWDILEQILDNSLDIMLIMILYHYTDYTMILILHNTRYFFTQHFHFGGVEDQFATPLRSWLQLKPNSTGMVWKPRLILVLPTCQLIYDTLLIRWMKQNPACDYAFWQHRS